MPFLGPSRVAYRSHSDQYRSIDESNQSIMCLKHECQSIISSKCQSIFRPIEVRLLTMSRFIGLRNVTIEYLKELQQLGPNLQIKLQSFPYQNVYMDRKSHGKSVVTEKEALISTSNFTPDYFNGDTGLSVVLKELGSKQRMLRNFNTIFSRFWDGAHSHTLSKYVETCLPVSLDVDMCDAINSPHADTLRK